MLHFTVMQVSKVNPEKGFWTPLNPITITNYYINVIISNSTTTIILLSSLKAKDEVLRHLVIARPQMLREVTQLSAVVNKATHQRIYMTINAVVRGSKQ